MSQAPAKKPRFRQSRSWMLLAVLVILALVTRVYTGRNDPTGASTDDEVHPPFVTNFMIFGTYGRLTFWESPQIATKAAEQVTTELQALHDAINLWDKDSELTHLNLSADGLPFSCSEALWGILTAARHAYEETDGVFDISITPLMQVWGFYKKRDKLPPEEEVKAALDKVGLDKVEFDDNARTVRFTRPGMALDMGGIAKGYGLDIAARVARQCGVRRGIIDLGGNIYCFPSPPPGRPSYAIGVRNPFSQEHILGTVRTLGCCFATSGDYENYREIEGKKVAHIIDPRTGYPVSNVASVTIITGRGVNSDVFSTAVFAGGPSLAERLTASDSRTRILYVSLDDKGQAETEGFNWEWE